MIVSNQTFSAQDVEAQQTTDTKNQSKSSYSLSRIATCALVGFGLASAAMLGGFVGMRQATPGSNINGLRLRQDATPSFNNLPNFNTDLDPIPGRQLTSLQPNWNSHPDSIGSGSTTTNCQYVDEFFTILGDDSECIDSTFYDNLTSGDNCRFDNSTVSGALTARDRLTMDNSNIDALNGGEQISMRNFEASMPITAGNECFFHDSVLLANTPSDTATFGDQTYIIDSRLCGTTTLADGARTQNVESLQCTNLGENSRIKVDNGNKIIFEGSITLGDNILWQDIDESVLDQFSTVETFYDNEQGRHVTERRFPNDFTCSRHNGEIRCFGTPLNGTATPTFSPTPAPSNAPTTPPRNVHEITLTF